MKSKTYNFYADCGHGWLRVKRAEVDALGIKISPYSYQRNNYVYLEEDCDMSEFCRVMSEHGIDVKIKEHFTQNRESKIRNYDRYTA